jgi:hypothetical protein
VVIEKYFTDGTGNKLPVPLAKEEPTDKKITSKCPNGSIHYE